MSTNQNCQGCQGKIQNIDFKQADLLRKFVSGTFKIISSRRNGLCQKHQREISRAVKLARFMALLPYTRNQIYKR